MSWTTTLDVSTAGPWLKESAFGFGPVVAERLPTPKAIMLKAIEEEIKNTASIFFMIVDDLEFMTFL